MAEDKSFWDKDWTEKNFGGKAVTVGLALTGAGIPIIANQARKMWQGDKERISDIEKAIAESEKSPYNEAQISKQNQDYYNKVLGEYARAQREAAFGLSPEEKAAARQTYAETTNLAKQNAMAAGGGTLGRYINANLNANQGQFATQLAAQDAEIKRQKQAMVANYLGELGGASQRFQDVQNLNFQKQMMAEQALGQAQTDWYAQRDANRRALIQAGAQLTGTAIGAMATGGTSLAAGGAGGYKAPVVTYPQNTQYGSFSDYGTTIG